MLRGYISTSNPKDLTKLNSEFVRFERVTDSHSDNCVSLLEFPHKWFVGSKADCRCTFRHLHSSSVELGFSKPVEWFKEDEDELRATGELYGVLRDILSSDYSVDLVDRWEGARPEDIATIDVSLDDVCKNAFRMFENHRFRLKKEKSQ